MTDKNTERIRWEIRDMPKEPREKVAAYIAEMKKRGKKVTTADVLELRIKGLPDYR